jgi:KaiC/GvpD/RAD55 family RecA-like ATPase
MPEEKKSQAEEIDRLMEYLESGGSLGLEIDKRLSELPEKYAVILVTQQEKYDLLISHLVKSFVKTGLPGIFVTLNKGASELIEMLQKNGADCTGLFVVDAISRNRSAETKKASNISYVDSPKDLTEIEAQVLDFAEKIPGPKFFVLDSLSTMLIYNAETTVEKFVHRFGERLRNNQCKAVFTIMSKAKPEIMNVLAQFSDHVIKTGPNINP